MNENEETAREWLADLLEYAHPHHLDGAEESKRETESALDAYRDAVIANVRAECTWTPSRWHVAAKWVLVAVWVVIAAAFGYDAVDAVQGGEEATASLNGALSVLSVAVAWILGRQDV